MPYRTNRTLTNTVTTTPSRQRLAASIAIVVFAGAFATTVATPADGAEANAKDWFAQSKYGLMFHYLPEAGMSSGPDGTWDRTVANFRVDRFVSDVKKTGARYVVFSVGQVSGYYAAPNAFYEKQTGSRRGTFTSSRDLIADLAPALKAARIKLMVYMAVEGPTNAPDVVRSRFPVTTDKAPPDTRRSVNAMLREWSLRWGASVSGWWLDGCYPGSDYEDPAIGEQAVTELMRSVKVGNPHAIAACNPKALQFRGQSPEQDFVAGEENTLQRYPQATPVHYKGKNLTWHVVSYVGSNWGKHDLRFASNQVASYVKNVSDLGGVVTLDLGVNADGSLSAQQIETMKVVTRVVRSGAVITNDNVALYKPVRMVSNIDGQELPCNGNVFERYASYAVDGLDDAFNAQASQQWDWSLLIDLQQSQPIARAEITYPAGLFPTRGALEVRADAGSWVKVADIGVKKGGAYSFAFKPAKARYVRVRSEVPNGPGQEGSQMAIGEVRLFAR